MIHLLEKMREYLELGDSHRTKLLGNVDKDLRYMALNDLLGKLQSQDYSYDDQITLRVINAVLETLTDTSGEVQNMGIKCLGPLVRNAKEANLKVVTNRLCQIGQTEELRSINSVALRTVILEIPRGSEVANSMTKILVPQILAQFENSSSTPDVLVDSLDVLISSLTRFESDVAQLGNDTQDKVVHALIKLLDNARPNVRKKAVVALGSLSTSISTECFATLMSQLIETVTRAKTDEKLKTIISLFGQLCKAETGSNVQEFANYLQTVTPAVLSASESEDDELKEIVLQSCEVFVLQNGPQIKRYTRELVDLSIRYLKYDPNYDTTSETGEDNEDEDDDMMDDTDFSDAESDFGNDGEYDDDDDVSWKVRRCASKLAEGIIRTQHEGSTDICNLLGSVLVSRFNEREETVRIEIISTFKVLIKQMSLGSLRQQSPSRKRSREDNDMDIDNARGQEPISLEELSTKAVRAIIKQLNKTSLAPKKICFELLTQMAETPGVNVEQHLAALLPALRAVLLDLHESNIAVVISDTKVAAMVFLDTVFKNSLTSIDNELESLVKLTTESILHEKHMRLLTVAIAACDSLLLRVTSLRDSSAFNSICQALLNKSSSHDLDQENRGQLIRSIGQCLRYCSSEVGNQIKQSLCIVLENKIHNEATRLASVEAIGQAVMSSVALETQWTTKMISEVMKYTNSTNKALRFAAITTSANLTAHSGAYLEQDEVHRVVEMIVSSLKSESPTIFAQTIHWLAALVRKVDHKLRQMITSNTLGVVTNSLPGLSNHNSDQVQHDLTAYFVAIAQSPDVAPQAFQALSQNLTTTALPMNAKFIAMMATVQPDSSQIGAYLQQARAPKTGEDARILALHVIGEYGARVKLSSDVIDSMLSHFSSPSDRIRAAAAFSLGNLVSCDLETYLPLVFTLVDKNEDDAYLLAITLKEVILSCTDNDRAPVLARRAQELWHTLLKLASDERAQSIVAECVGRLTLIQPLQLLPELQKEIRSSTTSTRSIVIRAVRYTFTTSQTTFDDQLRLFIVDFLSLMEDADSEVRRLALSTLYSAARNKPYLIRDHLFRLLPLLYQETVIRENLIQTIQMGPFKHVIDDGLELRKSAFETLHSLLDSFHASMGDIDGVIDIILRGLADVQEIKTLCLLMATQLATSNPDRLAVKLDVITLSLSQIMNFKLKDSAVKQDREKDDELKRVTLRCALSLQPVSSKATPGFNDFLREMQSSRAREIRELISIDRAAGFGVI